MGKGVACERSSAKRSVGDSLGETHATGNSGTGPDD